MDQPTPFLLSSQVETANLARPRCRPRYSPSFDLLEDRVLPAPAIPLPCPGRSTGSTASATLDSTQ